jgi:hypothetical protein
LEGAGKDPLKLAYTTASEDKLIFL